MKKYTQEMIDNLIIIADNKRIIQDVDFTNCDLSGLDFSDVKFNNVKFDFTSNLSWANLGQADLSKANLKQADLSLANLKQTKFDNDLQIKAEELNKWDKLKKLINKRDITDYNHPDYVSDNDQQHGYQLALNWVLQQIEELEKNDNTSATP